MVSVYPPASLGAVFNPRDYAGDSQAVGSIVDIQQNSRLDTLEAEVNTLEAGSSLVISNDTYFTKSTLPDTIVKSSAGTVNVYLPSFGGGESRTFRIFSRGGGGVTLSRNMTAWSGSDFPFARAFVNGITQTTTLNASAVKGYECTWVGGAYMGWFIYDVQDWTAPMQTQINAIPIVPIGVTIVANSVYSTNAPLPAYMACYPGGFIDITLSATPPDGLRTVIYNCSSTGFVTIKSSGTTLIFGRVDNATRTSSDEVGPGETVLLISTGGLWLWSKVLNNANINDLLIGMQAEIETKQNIISTTNRLDASFVGGGVISDTEFSYLNGTTSNIQAQINTLSSTNDYQVNGIMKLDTASLELGYSNIPRTFIAQYNGVEANTILLIGDGPPNGLCFSVSCRYNYKPVKVTCSLVLVPGTNLYGTPEFQFWSIKTDIAVTEVFVYPGTRMDVFSSQGVWWYAHVGLTVV